MKIYITKVENADFGEFLEKAVPMLTGERRERISAYKDECSKVTSAAAELLLGFAIEDQMMSGNSLFTDKERERGATLRPVVWRKLTAGEPGLAYTFTWSDKGKPVFAEPGAPYFSISHTANLAVVVISDAPVGIDIEGGREVSEGVVRRAFAPGDAEWILSAPDAESRQERFLRGWTLKESYVKMLGESVFSDELPVLFKDGDLSEELLKGCLVVEETYDRYRIAAVRRRFPGKH